MNPTIRVELPAHLRNLASLRGQELAVEVEGPPTLGAVLDAIETAYPMLRGTLRDHVTGQRRPFIRFFACQQDYSHEPPATLLPDPVTQGREPLLIIGAIAGGSA